MTEPDRLDVLERTTHELTARLARLEADVAARPPRIADPLQAAHAARRPARAARLDHAPERPASAPGADVAPGTPGPRRGGAEVGDLASWAPAAKATVRQAARVPTAAPRPTFEDVLAGRVLAWAGGLAVLVGIVLLFAVAVSRGWIGEGARTLMGAFVSFGLVAAGAWLHERRGRTDAALAAAAAGLGGLFVTSVVAARVYALVPAEVGTLLALATGALATALAVRWDARGIAALGILGGLLAPVLVGAPHDGGTTAILFAAAVSAAAVCARERWDWLGLAAFAVVTPQSLAYVAGDPATLPALATLAGFGAIAAAGAVGFELRERTPSVRPASIVLLALNAVVLAGAGWQTFDQAELWLVALAAAHLSIGVALLNQRRSSGAVGILACTLGAVLADVALAQLLDGPALTVTWGAVAVGFAGLVRHAHGRRFDHLAAGSGLGVHIALALTHALVVDVPPDAIAAGGAATALASGALASLAAACFASGLVLADRPEWRAPLHALGLAAVAYVAAANLDGALLAAAWAAEAIALAELARRTGDRFATVAAAAHVALAGTHALIFEAPPAALIDGLASPGAAALTLGACVIAAWRCAVVAEDLARAAPLSERRGDDAHAKGASRPAVAGADENTGRAARDLRSLAICAATAGALLALHLASTQLVTAAGAGPRAQALLSALWGLVGVAALVTGLLRDIAPLRTGALTLLLAALAKVFVYDLAALTPVARVVSFLVLGLLLLTGAFAWQRIRPRPLPDLRETAPATRG